MAANRTISTSTLAADGVTLTIPTAGGDGGNLTAQASVTGVTINQGSNALKVTSASTSGSDQNITVILAAKRISTDTLTVTVATSSNLTDAGGNTVAAAQTGKSVTNSSTVAGSYATATAADAAILTLGYFQVTTVFGRSMKIWSTVDALMRFAFSGSQVEVLCVAFDGGGIAKPSIDGAARGSISFGAAQTWTWVPIASVTDAAHTMNLNASGTIAGVDATGGQAIFRVLGATPSITRETGLAGTPTLLDGTASPYVRINSGLPSGTASNYPTMRFAQWSDGKIKFRAKCNTIRLWGLMGAASRFAVSVDGVAGSTATYPNPSGTDGTYFLGTIATGLDDSAYHEYEINTVYNFGTTFLYEVLASSATGGDIDFTTPPAAYPSNALLIAGDSIGAGTVLSDGRLAYGQKLAAAAGLDIANRAISGTTEHNFVGASQGSYTTSSLEARVHADVTLSYGAPVTLYLDQDGTNDLSLMVSPNQPAGATVLTPSAFQTSVYNVWNDVLTTFPTARIWLMGILERSDGNNSADATYGVNSTMNQNRLALNSAKQAAGVALKAAYPLADIRYVSLDGKLTTPSAALSSGGATNVHYVDGLHITDAAYTQIVNNVLVPLLSASTSTGNFHIGGGVGTLGGHLNVGNGCSF
jgi:hypothetical protein